MFVFSLMFISFIILCVLLKLALVAQWAVLLGYNEHCPWCRRTAVIRVQILGPVACWYMLAYLEINISGRHSGLPMSS